MGYSFVNTGRCLKLFIVPEACVKQRLHSVYELNEPLSQSKTLFSLTVDLVFHKKTLTYNDISQILLLTLR